MSAIQHFSDTNFQLEVLQSEGLTLVDFWAPWCGPCRAIGPVLDELAEEHVGSVKIGKVNVDENPGIAAAYGINSIPALLFFKNGEVVNSIVGLQSKAALERMLDSAAA